MVTPIALVHGDTYFTRCVLEMLEGVTGVVHSGIYLYRCQTLQGVTNVDMATYTLARGSGDASRCDRRTGQHLTRRTLEMLQGETDAVHGDTYLTRCVPQSFKL